jgi:hypothetical protein
MAAGQAQYPVDNNTYNLLQAITSKLESIEAYSKYEKDADEQSRGLFREMADQDRKYVERLMGSLKQTMR